LSRIRKISVTFEEFNRWLVGKGLKPLPEDYRDKNFSASDGDPDVFGSTPPAVTQAPAPAPTPAAPAQPIWKWSWDPTGGLLIWEVDPIYGQPHHIEVTGPNFYNLAQGRVYETDTGGYEILVWEDRASEEWQDQAVDDVNEWLLANANKEAEDAFWQGEGGYYPTIGTGTPDTDKMIEAYFQVGMAEMPEWKKNKLRNQYKGLFGITDDVAPDPVDQHRKNDESWLNELNKGWSDALKGVPSSTGDNCPTCGGEGTDQTGHLCLTCKGSGVDPRVTLQS
jgi:hypothetical protein